MHSNYDDPAFFAAYAGMERSRLGLAGAGEWGQFRRMLPPLAGLTVLDLGCGYGWHARYALAQGAARVDGVDASEAMLARARSLGEDPRLRYIHCAMEDFPYPPEAYDLVLSNLALHYVADLEAIFRQVYRTLRPGGVFCLNIEHPTFTAGVNQAWLEDEAGRRLCWPVDRYFEPGPRETVFLGHPVVKQHHTLTQILMGLVHASFRLEAVEEAQPPEDMRHLPGMQDEMRRPMMLLVRAKKEAAP